MKERNTKDWQKFHVTGKDTSGKRFKIETTNAIHAFGINIWRGSVWGVNIDGSRTLLRRVRNF